MDIILSLKHNKSKIRPRVLRYINGFSLDFRFKNERFECIDYDTSVYKKTIDDAIKINSTK